MIKNMTVQCRQPALYNNIACFINDIVSRRQKLFDRSKTHSKHVTVWVIYHVATVARIRVSRHTWFCHIPPQLSLFAFSFFNHLRSTAVQSTPRCQSILIHPFNTQYKHINSRWASEQRRRQFKLKRGRLWRSSSSVPFVPMVRKLDWILCDVFICQIQDVSLICGGHHALYVVYSVRLTLFLFCLKPHTNLTYKIQTK